MYLYNHNHCSLIIIMNVLFIIFNNKLITILVVIYITYIFIPLLVAVLNDLRQIIIIIIDVFK